MPHNHEYLTMAKASKLMPGQPAPSTVWRWCRRGIVAADRTRVNLRHARFGRRVYTSREWIDEFGKVLAERDGKYFDARRQRSHPSYVSGDRPPDVREEAARAAIEKMKQRRQRPSHERETRDD